MKLYAGTALLAVAMAAWSPAQAPAEPAIDLIALTVQDDDEGGLGGKLADQLFDSLKDFIKDVSAMRTMTEAEKLDYIRTQLKDRIKQKAYEQAYTVAENQAKAFALAQVKAAAWRAIEGRVRHEILINGSLQTAAWTRLKAELESSVDNQLRTLAVFGTGAKIAGKVGWDEFDKIVSNQLSNSEIALKVLGGIYDALGESYIPFYGPFKKAVELELALLEALSQYCRDETKQLWVGKIYKVDPLQGDFKLRLGRVLRGYTSVEQLRNHWKRNFTPEVYAFGLKVPHTDQEITRLSAEAFLEVKEMWIKVYQDMQTAKAQGQELANERVGAEVKARVAEDALKRALESGMQTGKDALALVDRFLTEQYPAAKAEEARRLAEKAKATADRMGRGGLSFTFEDASKLVQVVTDFGQQVMSAITTNKPVPNPVPVSQQLSSERTKVDQRNAAANQPVMQTIRERERQLSQAKANGEITPSEFESRVQSEVREPMRAYEALNHAQGELYLAAIAKAESELFTQANNAAIAADEAELTRIRQAVRLITEAAEKELARLDSKAMEVAERLAQAPPPNLFVEGYNEGAFRTYGTGTTAGALTMAPRDWIDSYEVAANYVEQLAKAAADARDVIRQAEAVIKKFDLDLDLLYPQFERAFGGNRWGNTVWSGAGASGPGVPRLGMEFFYSFSVPNAPASIRIARPFAPTVDELGRKYLSVVQRGQNGEMREIDRVAGYGESLRRLEERADLSRPAAAFWDKAVMALRLTQEEIALLPMTETDDRAYFRVNAGANYPLAITSRLEELKTGVERRDPPYTAMPRQFRTPPPDSKLKLQPEAIAEAKPKVFAPYKALLAKYGGALAELRALADKVPYAWIWSFEKHPRIYLERLIQLEFLAKRIAELEKAFDDEQAECERLYRITQAYIDEQRRINDENNRRGNEEMQRLRAEAEAGIRGLYSSFKSAYEQRDEALVASYLANDWKAPDGTTVRKLQDNLRRAFRVFDEVRFEVENLKLEFDGFDGQTMFYRVSYRVKIKGRIFRQNLNHEEVSDVIDRASFGQGKALIRETTSGRIWTEGGN